MSLLIAGMLGADFRNGANAQAYQRTLWQLREQQDRNKKAQHSETQQDRTDGPIDFAVTTITTEQLSTFQGEIDILQEVSVQAIMDYDVALDEIEARLEQALNQAHRLEDGRRVFESEDGLRVLDEHGNEVDESVISPLEIDDRKMRWETFNSMMIERDELVEGRKSVVDFQSELDAAEQRLGSGDMTQDAFEKLRGQLLADAPDAVRELAQQRGLAFDSKKDAETSAPSHALDIDLDSELAAMPRPSFGTTPGLGG